VKLGLKAKEEKVDAILLCITVLIFEVLERDV